MALSIQQMISRKLLEGAEFIAGLQGKDNRIEWINVMEILDAAESVQPGELLITTGFGLDNEQSHKDLIPKLSMRQVSGMVIQLGCYINVIPKYLIEQADAYGFPLITIPNHLTFSFIMHTLIGEIMLQKESPYHIKTKQYAAKLQQQMIKDQIEISTETDTFLLVFQQNDTKHVDEDKTDNNQALNSVLSFLATQEESGHSILVTNEITAVILQVPKKRSQKNIIFELTIMLTFLSERQGINYLAGVDGVESLKDLESAFSHAMESIRVLKGIGAIRGVGPYNNLSFLELFGTIHKQNSSMLTGNPSIQKLLTYDREHDGAFVHTLRVYLAYECNTTKTAQRLFIHRHTLINRLERIQEIGGFALDDYYTRTYLSFSLVIHDYFGL